MQTRGVQSLLLLPLIATILTTVLPYILQLHGIILQGPRAEQGGRGHVPPPPVFLKLKKVSKKKCLEPPKYRVSNVPSPLPPPSKSQSCTSVPLLLCKICDVRRNSLILVSLLRKRSHYEKTEASYSLTKISDSKKAELLL